MRASYVNRDEMLTSFGQWIAARLPHVDVAKGVWGNPNNLIVRVFGVKPLYRFCIFDYTRMKKYSALPPVSRLRVFGFTVWNYIN